MTTHRQPSGDMHRRDRSDLLRCAILGEVQVVVRLQVEPELRRRAEVLSEAQRRISRDTTLSVHDFVDASRGTPIDTATLFYVMPKPSMKSSMSTSPG